MFLVEIGFFDEKPPPPTMTELAVFLTDLIGLADHLGLRQPRYTTVSASGHIGLQLEPDMDSVQAVRTWAKTYCADVNETLHEGRDGQQIWVDTDFSFDDVNVTVYAHIPVSSEGPAETADDERLPF